MTIHNLITDLPINRSQFESVTSVITSARDTVDGVSIHKNTS